ncbi:uncharacterized protein KNAG_0G02680 [Huiozyma naganishii CBS 8797]|uniref:NTF2 domain-containing protein n=1 Tax=Huiozyma naganishii (strain ATCC MYA-139 / BCRC 22969 / CBS 8797 / KCTC 17520 / NBRC 10181 / NCYC 3082 / Yp74L-3) TaxID=1071383 RepID=J7S834_HUIN7|nr:hypothetical protein KNAG_0G02680 [Kazachstania naganishii CBS 8797]CCK71324.1 hypothetical protein KNAG_0G02680 [Kazachstania naganishii CBS 8797]
MLQRGFHNANNVQAAALAQQQQGRVRVRVQNWTNASLQDLLNFLSRNARVAIQDAQVEGALAVGYVGSREQADALRKWNGVRFAGDNLKIEIVDTGSGNAGTSNTVQFLRSVLVRRYNSENRMLDLGGVVNDQEVAQSGMFSNVARQSKLLPALLKVASREAQFIVLSVNLADNNLRDTAQIADLWQVFPLLQNLCLANNSLSRFQLLSSWRNKFTNLKELLMVNNPLAKDPNYKSEMLMLFPKLVVLDNVIVRDETKLKSVYSFPAAKQPFFCESTDLTQLSTDFLSYFLNLWDNNREQLLGMYSPQSQFSVSVDTSIPPSTVDGADQNPSFGYYLPVSRNCTKVSTPKLLQERLSIGFEAIGAAFQSIPKTKHSLLESPTDYSMEVLAFPQVSGFTVTLHGEFQETDKPLADTINKQVNKKSYVGRNKKYGNNTTNKRLSKKSFDRTWVIIPVNNSMVIASDLLSIRAYVNPSWKPDVALPTGPQSLAQPPVQAGAAAATVPMPAAIPTVTQPIGAGPQQGATPIPGPPLGPAGVPQLAPTLQLPSDVQSKLNPVQLELLNKLHLETKLNAEYTYMLADQSGWDYQLASTTFQQSIPNLPQNAFVL